MLTCTYFSYLDKKVNFFLLTSFRIRGILKNVIITKFIYVGSH